MTHHIERCEHGYVHGQCRCPAPVKPTRIVPCHPNVCPYTDQPLERKITVVTEAKMIKELLDSLDQGEEDHLNPRREQVDLAETILLEMILSSGYDHETAHKIMSTFGWGRWNAGWSKGWDSGRARR